MGICKQNSTCEDFYKYNTSYRIHCLRLNSSFYPVEYIVFCLLHFYFQSAKREQLPGSRVCAIENKIDMIDMLLLLCVFVTAYGVLTGTVWSPRSS